MALNALSQKSLAGQKKLFDRVGIPEVLKEIPLAECTTIAAHILGFSQSMVLHMTMNKNVICPHTSALKPMPTNQNKLYQMLLIMEQVNPDTRHYYEQFNRVHINEKWFYMMKTSIHYYLFPDKELPECHVKSKNHLVKVMFLCAVAHPHGNFNGKIGMWPFANLTRAQCMLVEK